MSEISDKVREIINDFPEETADQRAERYERALNAIKACTLTGVDFGDWLQEACTDVLEGLDATCWNCGTDVHDGACVGDGDES